MNPITESEKRRENEMSTALKNIVVIVAAVSLLTICYGVLYGYWALIGIGVLSFVVIFIDVVKAQRKRLGGCANAYA